MEELLIGAALLVILSVAIGIPILLICVVSHARRLRQIERRIEEFQAPPSSVPHEAAPPIQAAAPTPAIIEAEVVTPPPLPVLLETGAITPEIFESWVGRRGLGWVAVLLLVLATGFFVKQAFDSRWIGELGRVTLGIITGLALCGAGFRYHRRSWRAFSQMLTAAGVALLYLTTFAAFGYYHLLPQSQASVFLVTLVVETALLAVAYEAPAVAVMAIVGGLLAPVLLRSDHDQYRQLFLYLTALNAGVVGLGALRAWPGLASLSLAGTQVLFWGWYADNYHPEKLPWAIGFQTSLFGLYLLYSLSAHVLRRRNASIEDLLRMLAGAGLFSLAAYVLLDTDYHVWMGSLAVLLAVVYTLLGATAFRLRPDDPQQTLFAVAVALGFVAVAIAWQAAAVWIALGWAIQGGLLWWLGCRVQSRFLRALAGGLLALAVGRFLVVNTPQAHAGLFVPVLNQYALPGAALVGCLLSVTGAVRRFRSRLGPLDVAAAWIAGLGACALAWWLVSIETYDFFQSRIHEQAALAARLGPDARNTLGQPLHEVAAATQADLQRTAQTALSVAWAVYAAVVLTIGFLRRNYVVRLAALAIFGLTLAKVLLVDMAHLPGFYRVTALFALSLVMAGAAWAYQQWHFSRGESSGKDHPHVPR